MTSDKLAEAAILLHNKVIHTGKRYISKADVVSFVASMYNYEKKLTTLNSRLKSSLSTEDLHEREQLKTIVREFVFNTSWHPEIGPVAFYADPADAAIKFSVGKRYSNHPDGESLTFKIN